MAIHFEKLPTNKPTSSTIQAGTYPATIVKAEMVTSKAGNENLKVTFKTDNGDFVNEFYMDSDNQFVMYKLGKLLESCVIDLKGEGSLKDVGKVIVNKRVVIDVAVNDKGYGTLDYSNGKDGINKLPVATSAPTSEATTSMDPELKQAIETDEDF